MSEAPRIQIGEVAERTGLSLRTVRYYEEQSLIEPDARTDGGFRLYTDEQVDRLLLIKQMKPLGFTVVEMRELLDARDTLAAPDADDARRHAAGDRLARFSEAAAAKCDELRTQLGRAEEFARSIARETARSGD